MIDLRKVAPIVASGGGRECPGLVKLYASISGWFQISKIFFYFILESESILKYTYTKTFS
jgi:hypothetical protein